MSKKVVSSELLLAMRSSLERLVVTIYGHRNLNCCIIVLIRAYSTGDSGITCLPPHPHRYPSLFSPHTHIDTHPSSSLTSTQTHTHSPLSAVSSTPLRTLCRLRVCVCVCAHARVNMCSCVHAVCVCVLLIMEHLWMLLSNQILTLNNI